MRFIAKINYSYLRNYEKINKIVFCAAYTMNLGYTNFRTMEFSEIGKNFKDTPAYGIVNFSNDNKRAEITFKEETTWKGSIDFDKLNGEGILNSINDRRESSNFSISFKKYKL